MGVPQRFKIEARPVAAPEAVVTAPGARFTVLTPRLLRLEYSPDGTFEDRPSQVFWHRQQLAPPFEARRAGAALEIETEALRLRYQADGCPFHRRSLSVLVRATGATWRPGERDRGNLLGTARTLDEADGPVRLPPGLMSRSGWTLVDDSASLVFTPESWLAARDRAGSQDLYFFGYGHDYAGCLRDFCRVSGPIPLVPRWALGNWWSRYWEYTQAELTELMEAFRARQVPLAVCIVDMDWHITQTGNASSGWTGYTWNRELFPEPEAFLQWLHAQGLKAALNLHPADGVWPHEAAYAAMARRLGQDPAAGEPVPFDISDPVFMDAYFEILHHPMERAGVDFWWLDWQQGQTSRLQGLDPLWWLNHLHYYDLGRAGEQRPFIFSRWGGLGNHRYPIGFSGDTIVSWKSLAFQPYLTATAANVGCTWWSHDIGGHMFGTEDAELYLRWVQWGAFSPVLRLHSTKNAYHDRRPWGYDAEILRLAREAMQLRHALIPYVYAMAWKTAVESQPLLRPLYWLHPEAEAAYHCPNVYYFGSELLCAPYTTPRDPDTGLSRQPLWLPPGDWFDFFTGAHWHAPAEGRWLVRHGSLEDVPVLARAGAVVPLGPMAGWGGTENPAELSLIAFPGADGRFELYEDDGTTQAYQAGAWAVTEITQTWQTNELRVRVAPATRRAEVLPVERTLHLHVRGVRQPDEAAVTVNGAPAQAAAAYEPATETLSVTGLAVTPADEVVLALRVAEGTLMRPRDRRAEQVRAMLRAFRLESDVKRKIDRALPALLSGEATVVRFSEKLTGAQVEALRAVIG